MYTDEDKTDPIPSPLTRITDLETGIKDLKAKVDKTDPVSPRMLALVTVVCLMVVVSVLGGMKVVTTEVIAAILGAVAGRLTSNIGGSSESGGKSS